MKVLTVHTCKTCLTYKKDNMFSVSKNYKKYLCKSKKLYKKLDKLQFKCSMKRINKEKNVEKMIDKINNVKKKIDKLNIKMITEIIGITSCGAEFELKGEEFNKIFTKD